LGTRHVEDVVAPQAAESLDELVQFFDEPFADASAIATMCVSRLARRHVKVALSGDGGDEAFGGYTRYAHDLREAAWRNRIPSWLRRTLIRSAANWWPKADWLPRPLRARTSLANLAMEPAEAYANTVSICRQTDRRGLLNGDLRRQLNGYRPEAAVARAFGNNGADPLRGMIAADVATLLPDDFLTKVDRASMAFGLEVRPPLVDHEFLELAAKVPSRWKVRNGETKWLFKQLCGDLLPPETIHRRKQGFEIPVDDWLRGPLRERIECDLLSPSARVADYLDMSSVRRLYQNHLKGSRRNGSVLWSLLVLESWMDNYLPMKAEQDALVNVSERSNSG
jgi:asparagine synthase (glutamine-hydrolysing)